MVKRSSSVIKDVLRKSANELKPVFRLEKLLNKTCMQLIYLLIGVTLVIDWPKRIHSYKLSSRPDAFQILVRNQIYFFSSKRFTARERVADHCSRLTLSALRLFIPNRLSFQIWHIPAKPQICKSISAFFFFKYFSFSYIAMFSLISGLSV